MYLFVRFLILLCCGQIILSARILCVFPTPSISHQVVFKSLTQALTKRAQELVILTPDPAHPKNRPKDNITEIDVHDFSYEMFIDQMQKSDLSKKGDKVKDLVELMHIVFYNVFFDMVNRQLNVPEMKVIMENDSEHFDLIIIEPIFRANCFLGRKFNAPVIGFMSLQAYASTYEIMGAPVHPILYPDMYREKLTLTFWDSLDVIYMDFRMRKFFSNLKTKENQFIDQYLGKNALDINKCLGLMGLLFVNAKPIWTGAKPLPQTIINIGGIHTSINSGSLPKELQHYLDNSTHGVVYMSFGSNVKSSDMSPVKVQMFSKTFAALPYDVLWKWETDELPGRPSNVKIDKWLPQNALLKHPKLKVFITQGGLQSTDEAIDAKVPLIGIPFFAHQELNVQRYVQHGVGVALDFESLTEQGLRESILKVINNKSYRQKMERLSELMHDEPEAPLERAIWWTEYVIRHKGAKHLRSPAAGVNFMEYYMVDVLAVCLVLSFVALSILGLIVIKMYKLIKV